MLPRRLEDNEEDNQTTEADSAVCCIAVRTRLSSGRWSSRPKDQRRRAGRSRVSMTARLYKLLRGFSLGNTPTDMNPNIITWRILPKRSLNRQLGSDHPRASLTSTGQRLRVCFGVSCLVAFGSPRTPPASDRGCR